MLGLPMGGQQAIAATGYHPRIRADTERLTADLRGSIDLYLSST